MEKFDKQAIDQQVRDGLPFKHHWHNRFHLEMPVGLINDPNGMTYLDGVYHIFYQWNPYGPVHKNKSWAHTTTKDFIHYSYPELSLNPTDVHDKDGCYSGCGLVENGEVRILYTCNSKDENNVRIPAQRFGTLMNDGIVRKDSIIVEKNPEGITGHFRDPNIFYDHGSRYFVLGAQRENETGTVLIYSEDNDKNWNLLGELKTELVDFGYMWECPGLIRFGDYDALIFCPQGLKEEEYQYQNLYQAGYIVGHVSLDSMEMIHGKFQELDKGFDFYAPQAFSQCGRKILLGWMGMPDKDSEYPTGEVTDATPWRYSLTLPRVLSLYQGHIYSQPVDELKALRKNHLDIDANANNRVESNLFEGTEIDLNIEFGSAEKITLALEYDSEKVCLEYDRSKQVFMIDRNGMKLGGKGQRKFKLFADKNLELKMFVDKTAIEIFLQNGMEAASFFVFPEKDVIPKMVLQSDQNFDRVSGKIFELGSFIFE